MRQRPRTVLVLAIPLVAGLFALPRSTRGENAAGRLEAAAEAVAAAQSALLAWAAGDPVNAPAIGLTELQALHPGRWSSVDGSEAGSFAQLELGAAAGQLEEARSKLLALRLELGAPVWPAPPFVVEGLDIRGLFARRDPVPPYLGLGGTELPPPEVVRESEIKEGCGIAGSLPRDVVEELAGERTEGTFFSATDAQLIARLSPRGMERARQVIAFAREQVRPSLSLDVRLVRMSRALASELLRPSSGPTLSPDATTRLTKALAQGECELLLERRLAAASGATVHAFSGSELHAPVELAGVATSSTATEARTGTIVTGACVELRASAIPGSELVDLAASVAVAEPQGAAKVSVFGSAVELPELSFVRSRARAVIALGRSSIVLGSFVEAQDAQAEAPRACVLVVTPTRIARPPLETVPEPVAPPAPAAATVEPPLPLPDVVLRIDSLIPILDRALAAAKASSPYVLACYPLQDLLDLGSVGSATPLGLSGPGTRGTVSPLHDSGSLDGDFEPERIESWIRNLSGSDTSWCDPATLRFWHRSFIVRQTPAMHASIEQSLTLLRAGRSRTFEVEAGLYRIEPVLLAAIEQAAEQAGGGGGELPASALERLDAGTKAGQAVLVTGALGLSRAGSTLALQLGRERRFVAGYERGRALLGIARTGFEVEATVHDESGAFALDAELRHVRPTGAHPTTLAAGALEGPALDVEISSVRVLLPPGSGTLVAFRRGAAGAPVPCWVLRVRPS